MAANTEYAVTRDNVILEALELLGALAEGESASSNQTTSCARTLNMLLKHWQGQGINLYAVRETFLFLIDGVGEYKQFDFNGTTGLDVDRDMIYVMEYQRIAFSESSTTVVLVNEAFNAGLPVATAVATDVLGIPLEDGTMHWVEISAVGSSGAFSKSFTFSSHALAASTDPDTTKDLIVATVYPGRPIKMLAGAVRHFYNDTERPIKFISPSDYNMQANKVSTGEPNQVMYNRETIVGDLRTWPVNDSPYKVLVMWAQVPMSDIDTDVGLNTNFGIPQEFYMAFAYSLAEALIPKYGIPPDMMNTIRSLAKHYRDEAFTYDTGESIEFEPEHGISSEMC
jgi:hypothetical protein